MCKPRENLFYKIKCRMSRSHHQCPFDYFYWIIASMQITYKKEKMEKLNKCTYFKQKEMKMSHASLCRGTKNVHSLVTPSPSQSLQKMGTIVSLFLSVTGLYTGCWEAVSVYNLLTNSPTLLSTSYSYCKTSIPI